MEKTTETHKKLDRGPTETYTQTGFSKLKPEAQKIITMLEHSLIYHLIKGDKDAFRLANRHSWLIGHHRMIWDSLKGISKTTPPEGIEEKLTEAWGDLSEIFLTVKLIKGDKLTPDYILEQISIAYCTGFDEQKNQTAEPPTFTPIAKPRKWFMDESIFVDGRPNQFTGEAGIGKSSFSRETGWRYWNKGGAVVLFAQEDSPSEDIAPFLVSKGFPEWKNINRFWVFTDWIKDDPIKTLIKLKHIHNKLVVFDPVHALFADVSNSAGCRKILLEIRDKALAPGDTSIFVNHPKSYYKEQKLSASEVNASSKEIGRICRGCTIIKVNDDTGVNIIEHTKKQLNSKRYSFKLVEDNIQNADGEVCTFSKIEDFKPLEKEPDPRNTILINKRNLSKERMALRKEIQACCLVVGGWTYRTNIETAVKRLKVKEWKLNQELSQMVKEGILDSEPDGSRRKYMVHGQNSQNRSK